MTEIQTCALPISLVFFVDVPGFMVGLKAEEEVTLREGMRAVYIAGNLKVPTITLVIRKCYGMAGMATCNKNGEDLQLAWTSAEWGSLPVEGRSEVHTSELKSLMRISYAVLW